VDLSYSVSPHTQIGGNVTSSRTVSWLYDGYTTTSTGSLGWRLRTRWFFRVYGGGGVATPVRRTARLSSAAPSQGLHPAGGGSLGFRTFAHTLLGSFDRTVSDQYGVGASTSSTASATWRWRRPGLGWWLESGFSWQELRGSGTYDTSAWRGTGGLGAPLGTHAAVLLQYVYLDSAALVDRRNYSQSQSALRVSIIWTPQPVAQR
jgi:hypothetical protein